MGIQNNPLMTTRNDLRDFDIPTNIHQDIIIRNVASSLMRTSWNAFTQLFDAISILVMITEYTSEMLLLVKSSTYSHINVLWFPQGILGVYHVCRAHKEYIYPRYRNISLNSIQRIDIRATNCRVHLILFHFQVLLKHR